MFICLLIADDCYLVLVFFEYFFLDICLHINYIISLS